MLVRFAYKGGREIGGRADADQKGGNEHACVLMGRILKDKGVDDCRALERIYDLKGSKWNVGSELEYFH